MRLIKDNHGVGLPAVLAAIVIVGLIGLGGWYIFTSNSDDEKTAQSYTEAIDSGTIDPEEIEIQVGPEEEAETGAYMTISEWDVKIPVDNTVSGLSYSYLVPVSVVQVRSDALNSVSGDCTSNSVLLSRGRASDSVPNHTDEDDGESFIEAYNYIKDSSTGDMTTRSIALNIGEYYFVPPGIGGASCISTSDSPDLDVESTAMINIATALTKIESTN